MFAIETTKLTKYYGKDRGIENLGLQVKEGWLIRLILPN